MNKELKIVEGVEGLYVYHISITGENMQPSLCGNRKVMRTSLSLSKWGLKSHLNQHYCKICEDKLKNEQ